MEDEVKWSSSCRREYFSICGSTRAQPNGNFKALYKIYLLDTSTNFWAHWIRLIMKDKLCTKANGDYVSIFSDQTERREHEQSTSFKLHYFLPKINTSKMVSKKKKIFEKFFPIFARYLYVCEYRWPVTGEAVWKLQNILRAPSVFADLQNIL